MLPNMRYYNKKKIRDRILFIGQQKKAKEREKIMDRRNKCPAAAVLYNLLLRAYTVLRLLRSFGFWQLSIYLCPRSRRDRNFSTTLLWTSICLIAIKVTSATLNIYRLREAVIAL